MGGWVGGWERILTLVRLDEVTLGLGGLDLEGHWLGAYRSGWVGG